MNGERSYATVRPARRTIQSGARALQRAAINMSLSPAMGPVLTPVLQRASAERAGALDPAVRERLEQHTGHDFSRVRVFHGPASERAAEQLGARAFTLGNSIYLGGEAAGLSARDRARLLTHEAVHTVQQGGVAAAPQPGLAVSSPHDAAEVEARQIAEAVEPRPGAIGAQSRGAITQAETPHFQRDLTDPKETADGRFELNLKTESHAGAKSGLSGTIKFKAAAQTPDSDHIRMLQIARVEDLSTGKEYQWTGGEANRNKTMTQATRGVEPGYFVDVLYPGRKPRTKSTDAPVSPYYIDDYTSTPGGSGDNLDGSKKGKTVKTASIWDFPGWDQKSRFSLETAAKDADKGYIYSTLTWGFTLSDPAKGKVENEHADANFIPSTTFQAAVTKFNEFFKNEGASTAPK